MARESGGGGEVKVIIGWVSAHRGIVGNERADGIAKEATDMEKKVGFKVPAKDWRGVTRETVWKGYQMRIEREGM